MTPWAPASAVLAQGHGCVDIAMLLPPCVMTCAPAPAKNFPFATGDGAREIHDVNLTIFIRVKVIVPATHEPAYKAGLTVFIDSEDDTSYWQFWSDLWMQQETVIVVEHDIIPTGDALAQMIMCGSDWCTQPYPYFVGLYAGLGCVKFTGQFMASVPDLWQRVAGMSNGNHAPKHWCTLDSWSQSVLAQAGKHMCRHDTTVVHMDSSKPSHGCN